MSVHSSGTGSSWNETLDVDQPHGLDYREWNDIRIGDRKRMAQEHAAYADSTVGGQHTPGGTGILLVETTANMTTLGAAADLTSAHEFGLACNTATDPTGATLFYYGDDTIPVTLPVSWNNILTDVTHTFGADSEITVGPPFLFQNKVTIDGTANFGDGAFFAAEVSVDGLLKVDGTATEFGGTEGVALFYDPTNLAGAADKQSNTFPNNLVVKSGFINTGAAIGLLTYSAAFDNGFVSVVAGGANDVEKTTNVSVYDATKVGFRWRVEDAAQDIYWIATGF